jgi:hypothetical protein
MSKEKVFIIEHCENCQSHQWNTRHDANAYKQHAINRKYLHLLFFCFSFAPLIFRIYLVGNAIKALVPDATVVYNLVPKLWAMSDIYC